jgi:hypothetical protein
MESNFIKKEHEQKKKPCYHQCVKFFGLQAIVDETFFQGWLLHEYKA